VKCHAVSWSCKRLFCVVLTIQQENYYGHCTSLQKCSKLICTFSYKLQWERDKSCLAELILSLWIMSTSWRKFRVVPPMTFTQCTHNNNVVWLSWAPAIRLYLQCCHWQNCDIYAKSRNDNFFSKTKEHDVSWLNLFRKPMLLTYRHLWRFCSQSYHLMIQRCQIWQCTVSVTV
jgi:hypothetical protein